VQQVTLLESQISTLNKITQLHSEKFEEIPRNFSEQITPISQNLSALSEQFIPLSRRLTELSESSIQQTSKLLETDQKTSDLLRKFSESEQDKKTEEQFSATEEKISRLETQLINLQNASKATFSNIEKTFTQQQAIYMGNLQQLAAGQEEIKKKMEEPLATVPSSLQSTDIQAIETSMLKAIAGVNSTTDLAIEGIAENMANLRKQIRDDYLPRIQKLEEIANIGIKAEQSAPENTETISKIGDLYTKVGNIMASYTQLQQGLQELQKGKNSCRKRCKIRRFKSK